MSYTKWIIIIASFLVLVIIALGLHFQFQELQDLFFYLDDWPSWIMLFLLLAAIKGIVEWIFKWELHTLR